MVDVSGDSMICCKIVEKRLKLLPADIFIWFFIEAIQRGKIENADFAHENWFEIAKYEIANSN